MAKETKAAPKGTFFRQVYMAEFNRAKGDNIKNVVSRLRAKGYEVSRIRHKTTIILKRPSTISFDQFKKDLCKLVQKRVGSMVLCSTTGRFWLLDNTGNRPGEFQAISESDL